jgi:hypothetical protein
MSHTPTIHFCAVIKNRIGNLQRLVQSFGEMSDPSGCRFALADYCSNDGVIQDILTKLPMPRTVVTLGAATFNRSQGLNYASQHAVVSPPDIVFFIDVDMLVPKNFPQMIRSNVVAGQAWFPICYSLHRNKPPVVHKNTKKVNLGNGWWRKEGKGMCGFIYRDFLSIGQWNERFGMTYGREDGQIARDAAKRIKLVRDRCDGLFHVWHPGGDFKTKFHKRPPQGQPAIPVPEPQVSVWRSDDA